MVRPDVALPALRARNRQSVARWLIPNLNMRAIPERHKSRHSAPRIAYRDSLGAPDFRASGTQLLDDPAHIPPAISPATGPVVTGSVSRAVHGGRPDPAFLSLGDRRLAPFDAAATPASDAIPVGSRPTIGQSGVAFSGASSG
jgi:hypothetical protein